MVSVPPPTIDCRQVSRLYGSHGTEVRALDDVTFAIQPGSYVAIMGPSGSGKSTLLNLIGCLDRPTTGEVLIDGEALSGLDAEARAGLRSRKIGFVFQQFNLLARTSALKNVLMPADYRTEPLEDAETRARWCLEQVGLADRMQHGPTELSGGQQQRVAIARALVNDPVLLLADEPTGALDSRTGAEIIGLFQRLNRDGLTVVIVTHDALVANTAERVLRFKDGKLEADDHNATPLRYRDGVLA